MQLAYWGTGMSIPDGGDARKEGLQGQRKRGYDVMRFVMRISCCVSYLCVFLFATATFDTTDGWFVGCFYIVTYIYWEASDLGLSLSFFLWYFFFFFGGFEAADG
jgi:hypothetical protein